MTRLILLISALALPLSVFAQHAPGNGAPEIPMPGFELSGHARLFYDIGDLDAMLDYVGRYDTDRSAMANAVTAGAYYRVLENLKLGAFYRIQVGERHDEDWIQSGGNWVWRDTSTRLEHTFMFDATPRVLLDFLPGETWVGALKTRYEVNLYEQDNALIVHNTVFVRPGLTWFWLRDREPVLNVSLQYGLYLPIGFGENWWYAHGPYASVMYNVTNDLLVDLSIGTRWIYWTESAAFDAAWPNNSYAEPIYRPWTINAGVVYRMR